METGKAPGQEKFVIDLAAGAVFRFEGQELTVALPGERNVVFTLGDGSTRSLSKAWLLDAIDKQEVVPVENGQMPTVNISRYTEEELKIALRRQAMLVSDNPPISKRTQRRWLARLSNTVANGGNEVLALVPDTAARGNRTARLSPEQEQQMQRIIDTRWASHEARSYTACHRELVIACEASGIKAPSYPTFIERIKDARSDKILRSRHGKRMAYQLGEFIDVLYLDTPAHGSRPFQYVHIDHTQLDIELVSSRTGKPLGRPWLTIAIDAFSRRILAIYLTFDAPSYHSVMMTIRDMVKRFGRLPEFIVVDNGRDFMSHAFEAFLNVMGVHLRFRPAGQPRHGAVMERIFGRVNTEYIHNLAGNTKATKNVRMTTGKHLPVNFAEWTLESMYHGINFWATEFYDQERHPALDSSPREAFQSGLHFGGARTQRLVRFNEDFLIATCPPVDREGSRKVHNQRGVKVNDMLYWHTDFRDPCVADQKLPVRYDPWDASSVYVRIKNHWVRAQCRNLIGLGQLTEFERRALTEEYTKRSGETGDTERARQRLREFIQVFTPQGALQASFERQAENKALYNVMQLASITPVSPALKEELFKTISPDPLPTQDNVTASPCNSFKAPSKGLGADELPDFGTF